MVLFGSAARLNGPIARIDLTVISTVGRAMGPPPLWISAPLAICCGILSRTMSRTIAAATGSCAVNHLVCVLQRYPLSWPPLVVLVDVAGFDDAGKWRERACRRRTYRRIATDIDANAPMRPISTKSPTRGKASLLAREWEVNALAEGLEELTGASV